MEQMWDCVSKFQPYQPCCVVASSSQMFYIWVCPQRGTNPNTIEQKRCFEKGLYRKGKRLYRKGYLKPHKYHMEVSWNRGTPSHHPFQWDFPYKPTILGTPMTMETPRYDPTILHHRNLLRSPPLWRFGPRHFRGQCSAKASENGRNGYRSKWSKSDGARNLTEKILGLTLTQPSGGMLDQKQVGIYHLVSVYIAIENGVYIAIENGTFTFDLPIKDGGLP